MTYESDRLMGATANGFNATAAVRRRFDGDMQLPQWLARFNRHVTNPVQRLWAGWAPTMGILEHVGRKSRTTYRTALTVFTTDDGIAVLC
jgi:hypothetical protein